MGFHGVLSGENAETPGNGGAAGGGMTDLVAQRRLI